MNARFVIAALLLVGGILVAFAGAAPQAALSPSQALAAMPGHAAVKGMVASIAGDRTELVLTDGRSDLVVRLASGVPATVGEGVTLVAEGDLVDVDGVRALEAHEILVGCPSKYRA